MENKIIDSKLEQLGIYELRSLARSVGVKSPTTKKREELISCIQDIKNGKTAPVMNNHFGRPCKTLSNEKELSNIILNKDTELLDKISVEDDKGLCFQQDFKNGEYPLSHNQIVVCGILRQTKNGTYYMFNNLKSSEKSYVVFPEEIANQYHLIQGDMIKGTAFKDENRNCAYMNEIVNINGKLLNEQLIYNDNQEYIVSNSIVCDDLNEGTFALKQMPSMSKAIEYIANQSEIMVSKGYLCVVVGLDISVQTKLKLNNIGCITQITSLVEDSASFGKDSLIDAINHVNALSKREQKIVVFVLDVLGIYHILDVVYKSEYNVHNEDVENTIKKLISLAKVTNTSSVSVCGITFDYQQNDYANEIKSLNRLSFN